jgi:hypothetical protein
MTKTVQVAVNENLKDDPNLMALHSGSRVYVQRADIVKIFCPKPALYTVRLTELIFGKKILQQSCLPDERSDEFAPLNEEILNAILSEFYKILNLNILINI